jgi:hypothetical protein
MKRIFSTVIAIALLLGLGALAVLARGGGDALSPAQSTSALAAPVTQGEIADSVTAPAAPELSSPQASTTGFNWVTLPLSIPALVMASDLRSDIQNTTGKTVNAVQKWNAVAQSYQTYAPKPPPLPSGDFALQVGGAYRVSVSGGGTEAVWSIVGGVPDATEFVYTLHETGTSDFNWIMLPLDKAGITMASGLKADIEAHSSAAVTVLAVSGWNAIAQSYQTYAPKPPPLPSGDFAVKIGYPYRVTVDVTSQTSVVWPIR